MITVIIAIIKTNSHTYINTYSQFYTIYTHTHLYTYTFTHINIEIKTQTQINTRHNNLL